MSALVRGHLSMSREFQRQELSKLMRLIGLSGGVNELLGNPGWEVGTSIGQVQGVYKGVPCKVVCMDNFNFGEPEMARSVSLVLPLASPTTLSLKLQNTESVRLGIAITQLEVDTAQQLDKLDTRLVQPWEQAELMDLGVPFVLTLLADRLTISIYGMYQSEFYEGILDFLHRIWQRVTDLR